MRASSPGPFATVPGPVPAHFHLLQPDDVEILDDRDDAIEVEAAIRADAVLDVICCERDHAALVNSASTARTIDRSACSGVT